MSDQDTPNGGDGRSADIPETDGKTREASNACDADRRKADSRNAARVVTDAEARRVVRQILEGVDSRAWALATRQPKWLTGMIEEQARFQQRMLNHFRMMDSVGMVTRWQREQQTWLEQLSRPMLAVQRQYADHLRVFERIVAASQPHAGLRSSIALFGGPGSLARIADELAKFKTQQVVLSMQAAWRPTLLDNGMSVDQSFLRMATTLGTVLSAPSMVRDIHLSVVAARPPLELLDFARRVLPEAEGQADRGRATAAELAVEHGAELTERSVSAAIVPLEDLASGGGRTTYEVGPLPTYNLLEVHHRCVLAVVTGGGEGVPHRSELRALPTSVVNALALRLGQLVYQCNALCANAGRERPFPPTDAIGEAACVLPNLVADNPSTLREFVAYVYKLVYEGSGEARRLLWSGKAKESAGRLADAECDVLWDLKHLRNWDLLHDPEHGSAADIRAKRTGIGEFYSKVIRKPAPTSSDDFTRVQVYLLRGLVQLLQAFVRRLCDELGAPVEGGREDEGGDQ